MQERCCVAGCDGTPTMERFGSTADKFKEELQLPLRDCGPNNLRWPLCEKHSQWLMEQALKPRQS